jgi:hypothetical protein
VPGEWRKQAKQLNVEEEVGSDSLSNQQNLGLNRPVGDWLENGLLVGEKAETKHSLRMRQSSFGL